MVEETSGVKSGGGRRRLLLVSGTLTVVLLVIVAVVLLVPGPGTVNPFNPPPTKPLKAEAGPDITIYLGDEARFDGSNSTGDIALFAWDFDRSDNNGTLAQDAVGAKVGHRYERSGEFKVTLTVTDRSGRNARDQLFVHVNFRASYTGTLNTNGAANYTFPVADGVGALLVTLQYPSTVRLLPADMNLYLRDAMGDLVNDTSLQPRDSGATQSEEINITEERYLVPHGDWNAGVKCDMGIQVDFTLTIEVRY